MRARASSSLRIGWLTSFLLAATLLPSPLFASGLGDTARQLAREIAANSGPGAFALELTNRSSLDDKSVREVRNALEAELQLAGVHSGARTDLALGTIEVVLSESLRNYVWTAELAVGSDEKKVALVSLPRPPSATSLTGVPATLKATLLFTREQPILDVAQVETAGGSRLLVPGDGAVAIYHQAQMPAGRWEIEATLPIAHSHAFPRDLRGHLLLRRDHLFDLYLPGTFCRSTGNAGAPGLTCTDSDDPWPLLLEDNGTHAFFAASRNFFTGALSPGIGKISNVPSFYSAAALPRSNYTLWAFAAVDGTLHLVDGITDQLVRAGKWGSHLAALHSGCGAGTQLLASENGDSDRDSLRAFEVPDRDPVVVSSAVQFGGRIVALWPESAGTSAVAIMKRKDTGWYEALRISISCSN